MRPTQFEPYNHFYLAIVIINHHFTKQNEIYQASSNLLALYMIRRFQFQHKQVFFKFVLLQSESTSSKSAKLHTVVASNGRDHMV